MIRKIICTALAALLIVCSCAVSVSAKDGNFYASRTKVTMKKETSTTVTITSKKSKNITAYVSDVYVCDIKFYKWKGDSIKLKLTAKGAGKAKVIVKNKTTKQKINISVKVK